MTAVDESVLPPEGTRSKRAKKEKRKRSPAREAIEWIAIIGGALLIAFIVKTFLLQAFSIPSASMVPTLEINDRVLVNKLSYRLHDVHRGDLVVFDRPEGAASDVKHLIKRVIAVEGDTIESQGDSVIVNGTPVKEPYRRTASLGSPITHMTIPQGSVFVMGDNRTNSTDSRVFGPIDEDTIVGRAFIRIWPVGDLDFL